MLNRVLKFLFRRILQQIAKFDAPYSSISVRSVFYFERDTKVTLLIEIARFIEHVLFPQAINGSETLSTMMSLAYILYDHCQLAT